MKRLRKNGWKMALDLVMAIILVLLYNKRVLGLAFHEIAGMAVCGLFIIHKLLNWKWIQSVTRRLFSRSTPARQKCLWVLDLLLLVCFGYVLVSGILISKVVFPSGGGNASFKLGHYAVAALALALTGIHVGLHMGWIRQRMRLLNRIPLLARRGLAIILSVAVLAFGTVQFTSTEMLRWLGSLGNVFSASDHLITVEGSGREYADATLSASQTGAEDDQALESAEAVTSLDGDTQSHLQESNQGEQARGQRFSDGSGPHGGDRGNGNEQSNAGEIGNVLLSFASIFLAFAVLTAWVDSGLCAMCRRKRLKQGITPNRDICDNPHDVS